MIKTSFNSCKSSVCIAILLWAIASISFGQTMVTDTSNNVSTSVIDSLQPSAEPDSAVPDAIPHSDEAIATSATEPQNAADSTVMETDFSTAPSPDTAVVPDNEEHVEKQPTPLQSSEDYYRGMTPVYQGARRGSGPGTAETRSKRTQKVDTTRSDSTNAEPSSAEIPAELSEKTSPQADSSTTITIHKMGKTGKIITAVGTGVAIGGVITFILVKNYRDSQKKEPGIPDPPEPPGF